MENWFPRKKIITNHYFHKTIDDLILNLLHLLLAQHLARAGPGHQETRQSPLPSTLSLVSQILTTSSQSIAQFLQTSASEHNTEAGLAAMLQHQLTIGINFSNTNLIGLLCGPSNQLQFKDLQLCLYAIQAVATKLVRLIKFVHLQEGLLLHYKLWTLSWYCVAESHVHASPTHLTPGQ